MKEYQTVTQGRSRRSNAGNRMQELLDKAKQEDQEKDDLFSEEADDGEFEAPAPTRDVFLDEFADTDDEVEGDDVDEEDRLRREERKAKKGKGTFNPFVKIRGAGPSVPQPSAAELATLDPAIDVTKMAPSTLVLELRKKRREAKRIHRSEARRSNLRASTLRTEEDLIEKEKLEKIALQQSRKGRKAQHETGEVRGARPMTQAELIAAALEEEERNKEALTQWMRREEERRELRRVGRKRVRGPRWTFVSRTVGKLVEVVGEEGAGAAETPAETPAMTPGPADTSSQTPAVRETPVATTAGDTTDPDVPAAEKADTQKALTEAPAGHNMDIAVPSARADTKTSADKPEATAPVAGSKAAFDPTDTAAKDASAATSKPDEASPHAATPSPITTEAPSLAPGDLQHAAAATASGSSVAAPVNAEAGPSNTQPLPSQPEHSTSTFTAPVPAASSSTPGPAPAPAPAQSAKANDADADADADAPTGPYERNYLILSQVPGGLPAELSLILGEHVDWSNVKVIPARNRPINRKPPTDPLTGQPACYRHPASMIPYASAESYATLQALLANRYVWSEGGWWAGGEADVAADGIEDIAGWREACMRGWAGGKRVESEEGEAVDKDEMGEEAEEMEVDEEGGEEMEVEEGEEEAEMDAEEGEEEVEEDEEGAEELEDEEEEGEEEPAGKGKGRAKATTKKPSTKKAPAKGKAKTKAAPKRGSKAATTAKKAAPRAVPKKVAKPKAEPKAATESKRKAEPQAGPAAKKAKTTSGSGSKRKR